MAMDIHNIRVVTEHTVTFSLSELVNMVSLVYPKTFNGDEEAIGKLIVQMPNQGGTSFPVCHDIDENATIELKIKSHKLGVLNDLISEY